MVAITTGAINAMKADPRTGRAEALSRAMLALIGKGQAREVHPADGAPFVVVAR